MCVIEVAPERDIVRSDAVPLQDTSAFIFQGPKRAFDFQRSDLVRRRQRFALFYLDVDGLKRVNDSKGHGAGDLALKELAAVLRRSLRKRDFAARLGGDEFALLLPGAESATATGIAEKVLAGLSDAMPAEHRIGASIGIVPDAQRFTTTEAVRKADTAMYTSKTAGGSRITVAEV